MMPKVTVLLPIYNGEKYLKEAIESVLGQTFKDFEFLIINDGSTDNSVKIINSYQDPRIKLIYNEKNLGLIASLNKGFELIQTEYIARMDCDDISSPDRLLKQINYLDQHPKIGVLGSWVKIIGDYDFVGKYYIQHEEIKASLLFNSSLAHPSVVIRKKILDRCNFRYNEKFKHAEDYEMWTRMIEITNFANLPEPLLFYRKHSESISKTQNEAQKINSQEIRLGQLKKIGLEATDEELKIHGSIMPFSGLPLEKFLPVAENWLLKIIAANEKSKIYDQGILKKIIADRWLLICSANCGTGQLVWKKFWQSPLGGSLGIKKITRTIKLYLKNIIKKDNIN